MAFWLVIIVIVNKIVEVVATKIIKVVIATKIMIACFISLA
jgi:hypothetical protein